MHSNHNSRDLKSNRTSSVHRDSIYKNDTYLVDHCVDRGREGGSESNGDTDINRPHSGVIKGFGGYKNEVYEAVSTAFLGLGLVGGEFFDRGEGGRVKSHPWLIWYWDGYCLPEWRFVYPSLSSYILPSPLLPSHHISSNHLSPLLFLPPVMLDTPSSSSSRANSNTSDRTTANFTGIAGHTVIPSLQRSLSLELFRPPKGLLIHGPPG